MKASHAIQTIGEKFLNPISLSLTSAPDRPIVYTNQQFCDLTLYNSQDTIGKNCRFLQGPLTDMSAVSRIRNAINSKQPICQDLLNYKKNGDIFYNRLVLVPFKESENEYFVVFQHELSLEEFKPEHKIDELEILDKTLNPVATLVLLLMKPDLDLEKDVLATMLKIKKYILSL